MTRTVAVPQRCEGSREAVNRWPRVAHITGLLSAETFLSPPGACYLLRYVGLVGRPASSWPLWARGS